MPSCREVEPLVTPYVDGEATVAERALVEAHLLACPPCRQRAKAETTVREVVRAARCRPCAPEQLRARCRAMAKGRLFGIPRGTIASWSLAAALVLVAGGVLLYTITRLSPSVLAAQLTLDHLTCFAIHADAPADAHASETEYERQYGQRIRLPQAAAGLQLVGVRRCYCGEGPAAHAMYRLDGRPVSLYMIQDASRSRASAGVLGHDAVIWSRQGTTYVLVGREPRTTLERLALAIDSEL